MAQRESKGIALNGSKKAEVFAKVPKNDTKMQEKLIIKATFFRIITDINQT